MGKTAVPPLGFEGERWFGNGLYECTPANNIVCYVGETLAWKVRVAAKPINVVIYNYNSFDIRTEYFVDDFFEAKMVIQAEVENTTSGGNDADTRNGQRD